MICYSAKSKHFNEMISYTKIVKSKEKVYKICDHTNKKNKNNLYPKEAINIQNKY